MSAKPDYGILSPDAGRIAKAAGGKILEEYNRTGLTCFRTVVVFEDATAKPLVNEGYVWPHELPDGRTIYKEVVTGTITLQEAQETR